MVRRARKAPAGPTKSIRAKRAYRHGVRLGKYLSPPHLQQSRGPAPIFQNLVAWWAMDEDSGNRLDAHANNTFVAFGGPGIVQGMHGNAVRYSGSEHLTIANAVASDFDTGGNDWGMWGWFYKYSDADYPPVLIKNNQFGMLASFDGDGIPYCWVGGVGGGGPTVRWRSVVPLNEWHFICAWNDNDSKTLFIQIDDAPPVSAVYTIQTGNSTEDIFSGTIYGLFSNMAVDELAMCINFYPSADDRGWLFNNGLGRNYIDFVFKYGPANLFKKTL